MSETEGQNPTEFIPTAHHKTLLSAFQDSDYLGGISENCRQAGIDRSCYYDWMDNVQGFAEWWRMKAELHFTRLLPDIYAALRKSASGLDKKRTINHAAAKILLDRFDKGFLPATKTEHAGSVEVDLADMTPEQLSAEVQALADRNPDGG